MPKPHMLAVCNQKGGVGKTQITVNLAAALADAGEDVVVVDFDPQGHLTDAVGLGDLYLDAGPGLYDALLDPTRADVAALIRQPPAERFRLIPTTYKMALADKALYMAHGREEKLTDLLAGLPPSVTWVLIDCPSELNNLTDNALYAARRLVVPIQAEKSSVRALELLFDQIDSLHRGVKIDVEIVAIVPNLVEDVKLGEQILADLRASLPVVAPFDLPKRQLVREAWDAGHSIFTYRPTSTRKREDRAELVDLYKSLATVVRERVAGQVVGGVA